MNDFLLRKEASRFFRFDGMPLRKSFEGCGERDGKKSDPPIFPRFFPRKLLFYTPPPSWLILFSLYRFTDKRKFDETNSSSLFTRQKFG